MNDTFTDIVTGLSIHPTRCNEMFAGLRDGSIYHSVDEGKNWTPLNDGLNVGQKAFPKEYTLKDLDGSVKTLTGYLYESTIYELHCNPWCPDILYAATADGLFKRDIECQRYQT